MPSNRLLAVSLILNMVNAWMWILEYTHSQYLQAWVQENLALSSADFTALFGGMAIGVLGIGGYVLGKKFRARPYRVTIKKEKSVEVKVKKSRIREL